jgi:hypothetical protein
MHEKRPTNITPAFFDYVVANAASAKLFLTFGSQLLRGCAAFRRRLLSVALIEPIHTTSRID